MSRSGLALLPMGLLGLALGGCMQATLAPSSDASLTPRDRQLLAHAPYAQAAIPETLAELAKDQIHFRFAARMISDAFKGIQKSIRGQS